MFSRLLGGGDIVRDPKPGLYGCQFIFAGAANRYVYYIFHHACPVGDYHFKLPVYLLAEDLEVVRRREQVVDRTVFIAV